MPRCGLIKEYVFNELLTYLFDYFVFLTVARAKERSAVIFLALSLSSARCFSGFFYFFILPVTFSSWMLSRYGSEGRGAL